MCGMMPQHTPKLSRRTVFRTTALALVTGSIGYAILTRPGLAVNQEILIDDVVYETDHGSIHTPHFHISVSYDYVAREPADEVRSLLFIDGDMVTFNNNTHSTSEGTGSIDLKAAAIDSDAFNPEDFVVPEGLEEHTVSIPLRVRVDVRNTPDVLLTEELTSTVDVTIVDTGTEPELSVTASGVVLVQESESDPAPT